jgi:peptidoglycan-N-acetylglucosamine deacetylase
MLSQWNSLLFPGIITRIPGNTKRIYLTFDDGPTPAITEQVLAFLLDFNAKATFFCRGDQVQKHLQLYNQIWKSGHTTGNHGYAHLNGWITGNKKYLGDFKKAAELVQSPLFRPPYGKIGPWQYQQIKQKCKVYLWTALSWDFHPWVSKDKCLRNSIRHLNAGDILVFHDTHKAAPNMLYVLPKLLEVATKEGFEFGVLT